MVDIYLNHDPSPFLSIPNSDIERLSNSPFRWIRYVMFSICGARGDLFRTLEATDSPVDYDTPLADLAAVIYYKHPGDCAFVDYQGLNDRITSTEQTARRWDFRNNVVLRDGSCVITGRDADPCDAAHLIPHSKGDEYIMKVVEIRSHLYPATPSITGIDDAQNGMLLDKTLHWYLGNGEVAFLKTPNYGLEPNDIKRVDRGSACTDHITLQQLKNPQGADPDGLADSIQRVGLQPSTPNLISALAYGAHLDVQFRGSQLPPPPTLILDYMYGVAAYNLWRSRQDGDKMHHLMEGYRSTIFEHIPLLQRRTDNNDNDFNQSDDPPSDNPADTERKPFKSRKREDIMVTAMDELNLALMRHQGITPQEAAIRWEKRMEEEELKVQEASRSKVMEWMDTTALGGS